MIRTKLGSIMSAMTDLNLYDQEKTARRISQSVVSNRFSTSEAHFWAMHGSYA